MGDGIERCRFCKRYPTLLCRCREQDLEEQVKALKLDRDEWKLAAEMRALVIDEQQLRLSGGPAQ